MSQLTPDVIDAIDVMVTKTLMPTQLREDVLQSVYLAILDGSENVDTLSTAIQNALADVRKELAYSAFAPQSLDVETSFGKPLLEYANLSLPIPLHPKYRKRVEGHQPKVRGTMGRPQTWLRVKLLTVWRQYHAKEACGMGADGQKRDLRDSMRCVLSVLT